VQLADHPGAVLAQRPPPAGQHPQHLQLRVTGDRVQPLAAGGGQRDRVRVRRTGLAALPGGEHPGPGRQLGRHVHDPLTGTGQPGCQLPAGAPAALDRPGTLRPPAHPGEHRREPGGVGAVPAAARDTFTGGHDLDRGRPLARVHPDDDLAQLLPPCPPRTRPKGEEGTATSS
jgi:hypothetical protein